MRKSVPSELLFKGREGDPRLGEWVKPTKNLTFDSNKIKKIVLCGAPDDLGVVLNRGRKGAALGPDCIRKHLFKMTLPMTGDFENKIELYDHGNLVPAENILETHTRAKNAAEELSQSGAKAIFLGGGHDFAAPHFLGFAEPQNGKSFLINIDPHLDVRDLENGLPNSGTAFKEILESEKLSGKNFLQFGIQPNRNAKKYHDYCISKKVKIQTYSDIKSSSVAIEKIFKRALTKMEENAKWGFVTFDMDCCFEAEGSSAAPTIGFSANELVQMSYLCGKSKKVKAIEIAEVAPNLDPHERSARIAAEMIYSFLLGSAS